MEYSEFVAGRAKPLPTRNERCDHATLGLIGEVGELADAWKKHVIYGQVFNRANAIEELGDLCFYLQMCINEGFDEPAIGPFTKEENTNTLRSIFMLANAVGALAGEHADVDELLAAIKRNIFDLALQFETTLTEVKTLNMKKLTERYPDGVYTDKHATERLDKIERCTT